MIDTTKPLFHADRTDLHLAALACAAQQGFERGWLRKP